MALPVRQQLLTWGIATAVFLLLLYVLGDVLLPFLVGGAIAYFLDPVADRLQRAGLSRVGATVTISGADQSVFNGTFTITRIEWTVGINSGVCSTCTNWWLCSFVGVVHGVVHPLNHALQHRHIDVATLVGLLSLNQRRQDVGVGIHACRNISD